MLGRSSVSTSWLYLQANVDLARRIMSEVG